MEFYLIDKIINQLIKSNQLCLLISPFPVMAIRVQVNAPISSLSHKRRSASLNGFCISLSWGGNVTERRSCIYGPAPNVHVSQNGSLISIVPL